MRYLIIGSGKLASHLQFYFQQKKTPYLKWSRKESRDSFTNFLKTYPKLRILWAISDKSLPYIFDEYPEAINFENIHFSGSFFSPQILGIHPLMTFGDKKERLLSHYESIPLIVDQKEVTTEFSNLLHYIDPEKKSLYHAWCVLTGNLIKNLSQMGFEEFQKIFPGSGEKILSPYLSQVFSDVLEHKTKTPLSGPWSRKDENTTTSHINSFSGERVKELYLSALNLFGGPNVS